MEQNTEKYEELIQAFHLTWDSFPGVVRLIAKGDYVLAVNRAAEAAGLTAGQICAKIVVDRKKGKDYTEKIFWERKLNYVCICSRKYIRNHSDNAD